MSVPNILLRNVAGLTLNRNSPPLWSTRTSLLAGDRLEKLPRPLIRFTDIVNGPSSGLGDGFGVGAIVTVWGQGFGEPRGQVYFTDSLGVKRPAAHIYYWKKADGLAPGGPAELFRSHFMYEVAFSLPDSAAGVGMISIERADGQESWLPYPFTVRPGNILWVAPDGNNLNAGTYPNPKQFINAGSPNSGNIGRSMGVGDIIYSRGVNEPDLGGRGLYVVSAPGTKESTNAIIAYPGTQSTVNCADNGFHLYLSTGVALSKYRIQVGSVLEPTDGSVISANPHNFHINACKWGRAVGNHLSDKDGYCMTGQAGAIVGSGNAIHEFVCAGNHIFDVGCDGTTHYQHTTYFTIRNDPDMAEVSAPSVEFNFLEDCKAKYGIHVYDQYSAAGTYFPMVGNLRITNNVIVNQKGSGINVEANSGMNWVISIYIVNNILDRCGMGPIAEPGNGVDATALRVKGWMMPTDVIIKDNYIRGYSDASSRLHGHPYALVLNFEVDTPPITVEGNIVESDDPAFGLVNMGSGLGNLVENNNYFNYTGALPAEFTTIPGEVIVDKYGVSYYTFPGSAQTGLNATNAEDYDIYGVPRSGATVGPMEIFE